MGDGFFVSSKLKTDACASYSCTLLIGSFCMKHNSSLFFINKYFINWLISFFYDTYFITILILVIYFYSGNFIIQIPFYFGCF